MESSHNFVEDEAARCKWRFSVTFVDLVNVKLVFGFMGLLN